MNFLWEFKGFSIDPAKFVVVYKNTFCGSGAFFPRAFFSRALAGWLLGCSVGLATFAEGSLQPRDAPAKKALGVLFTGNPFSRVATAGEGSPTKIDYRKSW